MLSFSTSRKGTIKAIDVCMHICADVYMNRNKGNSVLTITKSKFEITNAFRYGQG